MVDKRAGDCIGSNGLAKTHERVVSGLGARAVLWLVCSFVVAGFCIWHGAPELDEIIGSLRRSL